MKTCPTAVARLGVLCTVLSAAPALAQSPLTRSIPILHVHTAYEDCHFDLHPELTRAEFDEFAREIGSVLRFRQLGDTTTLGRGVVDIGLQWTRSAIDDSKGAWNNTMSHPGADHYLGRALSIPRLTARVGVSDSVDVGAWGAINPSSNYGLVGVDTKVVLMRQGASRPVSVAVRPSVAALVGPREVWAAAASLDVSVSRTMGPFAVYVGGASSASGAFERSPDVDLDPASGTDSVGYAGVTWTWRGVQVAAEVEKGVLTSVGFRLGKRF